MLLHVPTSKIYLNGNLYNLFLHQVPVQIYTFVPEGELLQLHVGYTSYLHVLPRKSYNELQT